MVPPRYKGRGLHVRIKGELFRLEMEQEEMASAWSMKVGTPYVDDAVFAENFHRDFSSKLGMDVRPGDVDFSNIIRLVEDERERRKNRSKEERRSLRDERKRNREENKIRYGYVTVDDVKMELGNYTVEPSSIFMGRGEHPMRGSWKEGPRHSDIELNLSPDAPIPVGYWKGIVWDPDAMWIARWRDKLSGKMKYVWPSDSSILMQRSDMEKFDKAKELRALIGGVKTHILKNLDHPDLKRRKTATVCYLIDRLKFRVGDEKEEDEADTVGASTLRSEHLKFYGGGKVTFDFLGKDSIRHHLEAVLDERIYRNLKEFSEKADSTLFEEVDSRAISEFLDEVMEGLSAKVFRTFYASKVVEEKLRELKAEEDMPDYEKKHLATLANLEAAKICNHRRTIPKNWEQTLQNRLERLEKHKKRSKKAEREHRERIWNIKAGYRERLADYEKKLAEDGIKLEEYMEEGEERERQEKSTAGVKRLIDSKRRAIEKRGEQIRELKRKNRDRIGLYEGRMEKQKARDRAYIEKHNLQIKTRKATKDYNLNTSLKSYIDPRIYYDWGKGCNYDWKDYYSASLRSKFSWVEEGLSE
jgi:DNA topoisomerase-1